VTQQIALAVIGGTGFYEMPGLENVEEHRIQTPFGDPSDSIFVGILDGRKIAFLARHGRGHRLLPGELPQRANFWALKTLGVRRVVAVSAVGSLRPYYEPGHLVIPDQLMDRTRHDRGETFFGDGIVAHVSFGEPFSAGLRALLGEAARRTGTTVHYEGTYVAIEGPAFGTRAESALHRQSGCTVVGMTALPEAKLAREAEMDYALLAAVTDYDTWDPTRPEVDAVTVMTVLTSNIERSRAVIRHLVALLPEDGSGGGNTALDTALITPESAIGAETRERLWPILERRLRVVE
jgi:5'-methylthioadenosine phosphorylase